MVNEDRAFHGEPCDACEIENSSDGDYPRARKVGDGLMKIGEQELDSGHGRGAQVFRDGLMISALTTRPLRRRNFSALEIGRTLIADANGVRAVFEGKDTKTGKPIEFAYPQFLRGAFLFYLKKGAPNPAGTGDRSRRCDAVGRAAGPYDGWRRDHAADRRNYETPSWAGDVAALVPRLPRDGRRRSRLRARRHPERSLGAHDACDQREVLQPGGQLPCFEAAGQRHRALARR